MATTDGGGGCPWLAKIGFVTCNRKEHRAQDSTIRTRQPAPSPATAFRASGASSLFPHITMTDLPFDPPGGLVKDESLTPSPPPDPASDAKLSAQLDSLRGEFGDRIASFEAMMKNVNMEAWTRTSDRLTQELALLRERVDGQDAVANEDANRVDKRMEDMQHTLRNEVQMQFETLTHRQDQQESVIAKQQTSYHDQIADVRATFSDLHAILDSIQGESDVPSLQAQLAQQDAVFAQKEASFERQLTRINQEIDSIRSSSPQDCKNQVDTLAHQVTQQRADLPKQQAMLDVRIERLDGQIRDSYSACLSNDRQVETLATRLQQQEDRISEQQASLDARLGRVDKSLADLHLVDRSLQRGAVHQPQEDAVLVAHSTSIGKADAEISLLKTRLNSLAQKYLDGAKTTQAELEAVQKLAQNPPVVSALSEELRVFRQSTESSLAELRASSDLVNRQVQAVTLANTARRLESDQHLSPGTRSSPSPSSSPSPIYRPIAQSIDGHDGSFPATSRTDNIRPQAGQRTRQVSAPEQ